jgi:hypothetical protein
MLLLSMFWNCTVSTRGCAHPPALSERHLSDHGFERRPSSVVRQRRVIGAANRPDGLLQHLQLGVRERRHVIAERICADRALTSSRWRHAKRSPEVDHNWS